METLAKLYCTVEACRSQQGLAEGRGPGIQDILTAYGAAHFSNRTIQTCATITALDRFAPEALQS